MATRWLKGAGKAVPSGDSLLIMDSVKGGSPPEKTITLAGVLAPKLVLAHVSVFVDQGCGVAGCAWRDWRVHIGCIPYVK
jgi:hypothetical protein